jgi:hypothetical protein
LRAEFRELRMKTIVPTLIVSGSGSIAASNGFAD